MVSYINLEITSKKIKLDHKEQQLLLLKSIDKIIQNQNMRMQQHYQEAIIATISHEQMNPLNSIINFTQFLQDQTKSYLKGHLGEGEELVSAISQSISGDSQSFDQVPISLPKEDLINQLKVVKIIQNSSNLMKLLNSAILNLAMINQ